MLYFRAVKVRVVAPGHVAQLTEKFTLFTHCGWVRIPLSLRNYELPFNNALWAVSGSNVESIVTFKDLSCNLLLNTQ